MWIYLVANSYFPKSDSTNHSPQNEAPNEAPKSMPKNFIIRLFSHVKTDRGGEPFGIARTNEDFFPVGEF